MNVIQGEKLTIIITQGATDIIDNNNNTHSTHEDDNYIAPQKDDNIYNHNDDASINSDTDETSDDNNKVTINSIINDEDDLNHNVLNQMTSRTTLIAPQTIVIPLYEIDLLGIDKHQQHMDHRSP